MVKAGIFLIARLAPGYSHLLAWQILCVGLGGLTMILGGWRSLREFDLKLILAFGTVSQLGFLMILVGVGDANVALAGVAMLVAHALFKASLFMVVGIIDHQTGTRDVRKLARLGSAAPALAIIAALASASMAGLPITMGFVGKEAALASLLEYRGVGGWEGGVLTAVVVVGSVLTMAYTVRFLWGGFGRKVQSRPSAAVARMHRPSPAFLVPAGLLAVAGVVAGFLASPLGDILERYAVTLPANGHEIEHLAFWHGLTPAL
jgi:multicomponent Na+:H+ antiporter subunit A